MQIELHGKLKHASEKLLLLRNAFQESGFDIRFVGGCVRDYLYGIDPHDFDLCTDASPDEQKKIYDKYGFRCIDTGLKHGTWSVLIDKEVFEITSLRYETEHDGRHATVHYIKDWDLDLERRDLTINAMSLSMDGEVNDPFDGFEDLQTGKVRFVGSAWHRINEDYLRILRWIRFHARFAKNVNLDGFDHEALEVIYGNRRETVLKGLSGISSERIWSEVSKIATGKSGPQMLKNIIDMGLLEACRIPNVVPYPIDRIKTAYRLKANPSTIFAIWMGENSNVIELANNLKWSNKELDNALLVSRYLNENINFEKSKYMKAVTGIKQENMEQILISHGITDQNIISWTPPVFPLRGNDFIEAGYSGKEISATINVMKDKWAENNYTENKDFMVEILRNLNQQNIACSL